jgi:hypothetical protein
MLFLDLLYEWFYGVVSIESWIVLKYVFLLSVFDYVWTGLVLVALWFRMVFDLYCDCEAFHLHCDTFSRIRHAIKGLME